MKGTERVVFGGAAVHAAAGHSSGQFMQENVKAEERQPPLIFSEATPYKCSSIKKGSLLIQSTRCQLHAIFLLAIVLSASFVYSEAADPNSDEGNCQFNLIAIAALSCQHHKDPSELPSISCCTFLVHAVDEIPPASENGECCLCRYTLNRLLTPALATSYISCHGKDRANVAKWTYPIETCDRACNKKTILPGMSTHVKKKPQNQHASRNTKILFAAVLLLVILLVSTVCFCWLRRKRDLTQTESRRFSSPGQLKGPGRLRQRSLGAPPSV